MRKNLHPLAGFGAKENIATIANGLNRTIRPFFTLRRFFRRHSCKNCTPTSEVFFRQILQSSPVEHELFRVAHFFKRPPISALESANFFRAANGLVDFCYGLLDVKQNCFFAGSKAFYGLGPAGSGGFKGFHRLEGASSVFGCFHKTYKKVQPVAIDPSRRCLGGGNYFGVFQKGVAGAFDGVVKPLCPLRPLRRSLPRPKSGFLIFRAECGYVDLFFANLSAFRAFCRFLRTNCPKTGCMAPAGRPPAPPLDRRFSVHSFKFCTTSMSQSHIVLGCLRWALCPALR